LPYGVRQVFAKYLPKYFSKSWSNIHQVTTNLATLRIDEKIGKGRKFSQFRARSFMQDEF